MNQEKKKTKTKTKTKCEVEVGMKAGYYGHEKLDVFQVAMAFSGWVKDASPRIPRGRGNLRKHLLEASDSIVLNIAEGAGRRGGARRNHFEIALGSAGECQAVVALLRLWEFPDTGVALDQLRRIGQMLGKMSQ